jgi:O-acetyl-ADP-ribose deacetylase (regulator of RNase III)
MQLPRATDYELQLKIGDPDMLLLRRGDITEFPADAIVNAANSELEPGGGVCGAIHRRGGPAIAEECRKAVRERGNVIVGGAVATTAGDLPAKYVIHGVGPVWRGGNAGESDALARCYRLSVRIADDLKLHSIAFPAISTGIYGYPVEQAAWVAIPSLIEALRGAKHIVQITMVLFDKSTLDVFASVGLAQRRPNSGEPYQIAVVPAG